MASCAANATNQSSTGSKSSDKNDDIFDRLNTLNKCDAVPPKIVQECVFHALEETIIGREENSTFFLWASILNEWQIDLTS